MTTAGDEWASPSEGYGDDIERDNFVWANSKGVLVLVIPAKYETGVETKFGTKDAVRSAITVLDGPDAGKEYPDELVFGGVLIGQIKAKIGRKVLGRVGQKPTDKGNPAWVLIDATDADKKIAREWQSKHEFTAPDADKPPF